jgi:hypothetical protein
MDNQIADLLSTTQERLMESIEKAKLAEKHDEFHTLPENWDMIQKVISFIRHCAGT